MKCELAKKSFGGHLGEPSEELERHLDGCPACARAWRAYLALGSLAAPTPPRELTRAVLDELDSRGVFRRGPAWDPWLRRGLVACTAACYLLLGAWLGCLARPSQVARTLTPEQARVWARLPDAPPADPLSWPDARVPERLQIQVVEVDDATRGI